MKQFEASAGRRPPVPQGIASATLSPRVGAEQNAPNSVPQSLFCATSLSSPRQIVFWVGMLV
jgi:hypothetical protein